MWLVAEDKRVEYAEEVYSITQSQDGKKLSLLCPTMQIRSRGDTLNRPTMTVVSDILPASAASKSSPVAGPRSGLRRYSLRGGHALAWCS